jgi:hypothetical protein
MKRYVVAFLLLAAVAVFAPPIGTGQFSKTVSATGTPEAITNATVLVKEVVFLGKSAPRTDNTGDVYVGITSGNDTQAFKISPGGEAVIRVEDPSGFINLADWYVDVTTASDGVTVIYR